MTPQQNFSRVYPQLSDTLSYTKIRRIRSLLADVGRGLSAEMASKDVACLGLEACTVALACVGQRYDAVGVGCCLRLTLLSSVSITSIVWS